MVTVTPYLKLNVPAFDETPWDTEVDQNWAILDATVGQFFGVANFLGVWLNTTTYLVGQSVVDSDDSSMWLCYVTHTSGDPPQTFAQDRTANPTYWQQTGASAADSAATAAASASAAAVSASAAQMASSSAANSATAAAASAVTAAAQVGTSVPLIGGTMTGLLTLSGDPTNVRGAATKQYVDARVGGTGFLPTTGGTLTGFLTLNAAPTAVLHAATKGYVDTHISSAVGAYLPLTGGTISGSLTVTGESQAAAIFRITGTSAYFFSDATYTRIVMDAALWRLEYYRSSGTLAYVRGSDNGNLFNIDGGGNLSSPGQCNLGSHIVAGGNGYHRSGTVFCGSTDRMFMQTNSATYSTIMFHSDGWQLNWNWADGGLGYYSPGGVLLCGFSGSGQISAAGSITSGAGVYGTTHGISGTNQSFFRSAGQAIYQFESNSYLSWNSANGVLIFVSGGISYLTVNPAGGAVSAAQGPMAGIGPYVNNSDETKKTDIREAEFGLPEVLQINPIVFRRKTKEREEFGFSAQQVQPIIPSCSVGHGHRRGRQDNRHRIRGHCSCIGECSEDTH